MIGIYLLDESCDEVWACPSVVLFIIILFPFMLCCDIMHPSRTLKKYRFDTTRVGIKITKYTLRERQICIGEGQDLTLIYYLMQHIKKQHINTYWKHSGVCLLSLCWFIVPSSGWSIAVVWSVLIGSLAHCGLFDIDCFSCGHLHLLSSASDNHNDRNQAPWQNITYLIFTGSNEKWTTK